MVKLVDVPKSPPVTMEGLFGFSLETGSEDVIANAVLRREALVYQFQYSGDKNTAIHVDQGVVQGTFWELFVQWAVSSIIPGHGPTKFSGEVLQPCVVLEGMIARVGLRHVVSVAGAHDFGVFDWETGAEYHRLTCHLVDVGRLLSVLARRAGRRMAIK